MEHVIAQALQEGRDVLLEHELLDMLEAYGLPTPRHLFLPLGELGEPPAALRAFVGSRGVLKVVSEKILHKSDVGGVVFLDSVTPDALRLAAERMLAGLPAELRSSVRGVVLEEAVSFEPGLGHELLLGLRHSPDFGLVCTVGFGGTYVEALGEATRADQSTIVFKPGVTPPERLKRKLERSLFFRWASGGIRGVKGVTGPEQLHTALNRWLSAMDRLRHAVEAQGRTVLELEFNPLVWDASRAAWVPVDALMRLGPAPEHAPAFPIDKLRRGLHPKSAAIMGASAQSMNVGRIILRCMLEHGFPKDKLFAIRDDVSELDGAPCVPSLAALPMPVDLLVIAVGAATVPAVLAEAVKAGKVDGSVLLIPGGMGETEGGKAIEQQVLEIVRQAPPETRPALIGNNSVGLASKPDRLDSLFIPREKLPRIEGGPGKVAFISQSGAFMITIMTKLDFMAPDYQISLGNQIDARISHFVEALADEPELTTYALYIEGFKPGDGERLALLTRQLRAAGRDVVIYKAGRSPLGRSATMGHTASIAGDYRVFADVLADAGALVADTFAEFVDLIRVSAMLHGRTYSGRGVAMLSNAGYEAVGLADNHKGADFELAPAKLSAETSQRIADALAKAKLSALVTVNNPLDLTPMANDAVHEACMRAMLDDAGVDAAVFGMVPLTAMVQSLPHGASARDVFDAPQGYANRAIALFQQTQKPFVIVLDGGRLYDPMTEYLQRGGVPVFRSADHAIRMLGRYVAVRLGGR